MALKNHLVFLRHAYVSISFVILSYGRLRTTGVQEALLFPGQHSINKVPAGHWHAVSHGRLDGNG